MDGANTNDESEEGKEERRYHSKREKPPDKRRHQLEMSHYTDLIQQKEALLKSLGVRAKARKSSSISGNRDELLTNLRTLRSEKEEKLKQKQVIDAELKSLNQQVVKKNETCMKLQANVKYKDEQRTNNAIKHLERHLSTCQLKLCEEKKLVCEIDALKRSKKTLSEYLSAKQEVDQLRQRQSVLRSERDTLIRETHDIKARENDVKVSLDALKEENKETNVEEKKPAVDRDALKKEIDSLYEKRRELHDSYKQALRCYHEKQKQIEKDLQQRKAEQRRDETRLTKITTDRTRQEKRHEPKPYEEEKNICVCLIKYLEPLIVPSSSEIDEVDGNKTSPRFLDVPKFEGSIPGEGSFVMKKDDNLGGLFVQSNRRITRKGSRKGRKSKDFSQKLVLHPHVFEQFFKLSLEPPSTYADVCGMLLKLREKKEWYEKASSKSGQVLPVISENSADEGIGKEDVKFSLGPLADSQRFKNHSKNVLNPSEHAKDLSWHEHDPEQCEEKQGKHEMVKSEREMNQVKYEISKDEHEAEPAERVMEQYEHERKETEHECEEVEHETMKEEHEMVERSHEKDQIAQEDDEENMFKNERSSCEDDEICTENMLNKVEGKDINEDNNKEVLSSSCKNFNPIISDALEKGMDSINIKETSQEIQVRVT